MLITGWWEAYFCNCHASLQGIYQMRDSNTLRARDDRSSKSSNNSVRFIIHNWISGLFGCSPTQGSRLSLPSPSCKPSVHSYDNYHITYTNWNYIRQSVSQHYTDCLLNVPYKMYTTQSCSQAVCVWAGNEAREGVDNQHYIPPRYSNSTGYLLRCL